MVDIFRDSSKSLPKRDEQIVRVPMDENEIGGRKSQIPERTAPDLAISHIPNAGSKS